MRHVYTAELARLRWAVVYVRTGALTAAFADCSLACLMRDNGPRNSQGLPLFEVIDCPPKITKPRLRQRRKTEPRQNKPLCERIPAEWVADPFNFFERSI